MVVRIIEYRQLAQILAMFMVVQFLGLLLAVLVYSQVPLLQPTNVAPAQVASSAATGLYFIAYIVAFAFIIILITRRLHGDLFFLIFEGVAIFASVFFFLLIAVSVLNGTVLPTINAFFFLDGPFLTIPFFAALLGGIAIVVAKNKWPRLRNAVAIIASVGVGVILGLGFSFLTALVFTAILAVYDFIAVFITKHMITIAKAASSKNLAFLVSVSEIEAVPENMLGKRDLAEYKKERNQLKKSNPVVKHIIESDMVPLAARIDLGTGDLAVPLMVAISAVNATGNFLLSMFVIIGAIGGLILTMFILRKYKRALPAIPPLFLGMGIAIIAYLLIP
ncbi:MAG: presenilin family intramembrane aspartyl protease [Candidatus Marsarchaeota archaeon]|nr:presenilin family intramembrane aspartyl protease [Candidatus Marsarchaeota archaeon]